MPKIRKVSLERRLRKLAASKKKKSALLKMNCRKTTKNLKFCDVVSNVLKISEKTGYDPATGTNWCHMPTEIRMQCIKSMNFRTRACLRGTSTTEKALVESKKYNAKMLFIDTGYFTLYNHLENEEMVGNKSETREESRKMALQLKLILKLCEFRFVSVMSNEILEPVDFLEKIPINCDTLEIGNVNIGTLVFFLKNCKDYVENIEFRPALHLPMHEITNSRSVYTAKSVTFADLDCACHLCDIFTFWNMCNAEVGTKMKTVSPKGVIFEPLLASVSNHGNIGEDVSSVRVPLGYNGKEVLVERELMFDWEKVTCTVVEPEPENDISSAI